ncbi:O-antigen ligase family protein [Confluentibacter flavum]|nr:O-antigen ligase family protein [Confluentibacter flavum]
MKKIELSIKDLFKRNNKLSLYLTYIFISISFPLTYGLLIPVILGLFTYQIYKVYINKLKTTDFLENCWFILIFSLVFFRSVHTIVLLIFLFFIFIKRNQLASNKTNISFKFENYILIFFTLIVIDNFFHGNFFKGLDTYLYLLLYPILFISLRKIHFLISLTKTIKVFISSVFVSLFYLTILNIFYADNIITTNINFSEFLDLSHVYYGMFLGLAGSLLVYLKVNGASYISKRIDIFLFLILLLFIIYIGARISLIAVILVTLLGIYNLVHLEWYKKVIILIIIAIGVFSLSFKFIPRVKQGYDSITDVYKFVINKKEDDLKNYSWENMNQRYLVLDYTIKELKNNLVLGIGIKNVKDVISNKIIEDGHLHFEPLNTHNQYLHFFLGMGIFGFVYFIFLLFIFLIKVPQGIYFLLFFLIVMLTESILVRVKGISLFFIFYLIFSYNRKVV